MTDNMDYAKVSWRCRRGLKELDAVFNPFFKNHFENLPEAQKQTFARLMEEEDMDLFDWFLGHSEPEDKTLLEIMDVVKAKYKVGTET